MEEQREGEQEEEEQKEQQEEQSGGRRLRRLLQFKCDVGLRWCPRVTRQPGESVREGETNPSSSPPWPISLLLLLSHPKEELLPGRPSPLSLSLSLCERERLGCPSLI